MLILLFFIDSNNRNNIIIVITIKLNKLKFSIGIIITNNGNILFLKFITKNNNSIATNKNNIN